ncbi:MAG: CopG family transcriptional regulator [bacterium]|nr:CopG family transcriptional regulator [bacterium]
MKKVGVTIEERSLREIDRWVREGRYPNRSKAIQSAVEMLRDKEKRQRLAAELAKLDPVEERMLAEEGLGDGSWPKY